MTSSATAVPSHLLGNSFLASTPAIAEEVWASVRETLTPRLCDDIDDCLFLMFKPDAVAAQKHRRMWHYLLDAGIEIVHVSPYLRTPGNEYEELYKFNLTLQNAQNQIGAWWINSRLFTMGPALLMMARVPAEVREGRTAYEFFTSIKGPAQPYRCRPGQLRYDLSATNTSLNLVHGADDPLSSLREFLLFETPQALTTALTAAAELRSGGIDAATWRATMEEKFEISCRSLGTAQVDTDLASVLLTVKSRLLTVADEKLRDAVSDLYTRYYQLLARALPLRERMRGLHELSAEEAWILQRTGDRSDAATDALASLAEPGRYDTTLAARLAATLGLLGLAYTSWEKLVVDTSMFYVRDLPSR